MRFRILIVDDESSGRQTMKLLLEKVFWAYIDKLELANTFENARSLLMTREYDLIFLDINLRGISAFDLLGFIPPASQIIFVTAYSEFVLKALRSKAFDYLLKPVKEDELQLCLNRIIKENSAAEDNISIQIKAQGFTHLVNLKNIVYLEGDGPYCRFQLKDDSIRTARTLKSVIPELNNDFVRIHKSFLVNLRYIKGFTSEKIILFNEKCLPVSRSGYKALTSLK